MIIQLNLEKYNKFYLKPKEILCLTLLYPKLLAYNLIYDILNNKRKINVEELLTAIYYRIAHISPLLIKFSYFLDDLIVEAISETRNKKTHAPFIFIYEFLVMS